MICVFNLFYLFFFFCRGELICGVGEKFKRRFCFFCNFFSGLECIDEYFSRAVEGYELINTTLPGLNNIKLL